MFPAGRTALASEVGPLPIGSKPISMDSSIDLSMGNAQTYYTKELQDVLDTYCSSEGCRLPATPERSEVSSEIRDELYRILAGIHVFFGNGQRDIVVDKCPIIDGAKAMCYSHRSLGYNEARKVLFGKIHLQSETVTTEQGKSTVRYSVRDVYCERDYYEDVGIGPGRYPSANVINTEHTWPQSRFRTTNKEQQRSDLHHLYPTNSERNSTRGNYPFGEVQVLADSSNPSCTLSKFGYLSGSGDGGLYFEPPDAHKGNVARALFYFSVRYMLPIGETEERFLRKWNKEDPVDDAERNRNQTIYEHQQNRNPFIDYPELADLIADFQIINIQRT